MREKIIVFSSLVFGVATTPAFAQGFAQFGGVNAGAAGLGAGLAASQNKGALVRSTYGAAVQAQESLVSQNRAIQQYMATGLSCEARKQWREAEDAFTSVLQMVCRRDGPGSVAALPATKHLALVSLGEGKLDRAIGFQKTVVAFSKARVDNHSLFKEERELSDMYLKKGDYASAEPVLKDSVALLAKVPSLPISEHKSTLEVYGRVLRELGQNEKAESVEAVINQITQSVAAQTLNSAATSTASAAAAVSSGPAAAPVISVAPAAPVASASSVAPAASATPYIPATLSVPASSAVPTTSAPKVDVSSELDFVPPSVSGSPVTPSNFVGASGASGSSGAFGVSAPAVPAAPSDGSAAAIPAEQKAEKIPAGEKVAEKAFSTQAETPQLAPTSTPTPTPTPTPSTVETSK